MKNRTFFIPIWLLLLTLSFTDLSLADQVLKIGMVGEPMSLNPLLRQSAMEGYVNFFYHRNLTHYNAKSENISHLVKDQLKFVGNDIHAEIRTNAKWDDGQPVVCADFEAGFKASALQSTSETILGVQCNEKNPSFVILKFSKKTLNYGFYFLGPLPAHLEGPIIKNSKDILDYGKNSLYTQKPSAPGLSNGPYKIKEYSRGDFLIFERNNYFFGKKPFFDRIIIRFFSNVRAEVLAFRAKQIDVISPVGFSSEEAAHFKNEKNPESLDSKLVETESVYLTHLEFNLDHPILNDVQIRKALSLLIDQGELSAVLDGSKLTGSLIHPTDPNYNPKYNEPLFRLHKESAHTLFQRAGFNLNKSGIYEKNGKPLKLTLSYNLENRDHELIALYLANQWQKYGIAIELKKNILRIHLGEILRKRNFEIAVMRWSMPKLYFQPHFFLEKNIPSEANHWVGSNFPGWKNNRAGENYAKAEMEMESDLVKLKQYMDIFQEEFRKDIPWLPLHFVNLRAIAPKKLLNFQVFPDWEDDTVDSESWIYSN